MNQVLNMIPLGVSELQGAHTLVLEVESNSTFENPSVDAHLCG
jgi:hypothetical protein